MIEDMQYCKFCEISHGFHPECTLNPKQIEPLHKPLKNAAPFPELFIEHPLPLEVDMSIP